MKILVIAEHQHSSIAQTTARCIQAACELGEVDVLVAGFNASDAANQAANLDKVSKVILADAKAYEHLLAEPVSALIQRIAGNYTHIFAPASTFGKNIMPRVAALMDVAQISDIIEVISEDTFKRPIYAGNAIATVKSLDTLKIVTTRTSVFASVSKKDTAAPIETLDTMEHSYGSSFVSQTLNESERPQLGAAKVVISGGRGMQNSENFQLLEKLADKLNAAIGASRAAVDAGYVPNDYQVGQTGKIVAPELYIAVGISGAIQHLAGMKDSKIIVAINKDEDAPIFSVADYGLVGDLFELIPQLTEAL